MPSYYNVIKSLEIEGEKLIDTCYYKKSEESFLSIEKEDRVLDSYENIGKSIIENSQKQKNRILEIAHEDAMTIKEEAYEEAYKEGYEKGYIDSYEMHMEKALKEAESILEESRSEANYIVKNTREDFQNYLQLKKDEIINLSYEIAKTILKKEIFKEEGMDSIILETLKEHRNNKVFIIRCGECHADHIKEVILKWKNEFALQGEIFVIKDNSLGEGNAVIEKDNGMITVGMDIGLENIKKELY